MCQECLLAYYRDQSQNLHQHFCMSVNYYDPDGIHDFRVEVKQLKAFFRLIERLTPKFTAKKNLRNIRKLFKAMADIRDVHVQQELTRAWVKQPGVYLTEYYNFLKQRELQARKQFSASVKKFDLQGELAKNERKITLALKTVSDEYAATQTEARVSQLLDQIVTFGNEHKLQEEYLHKVRILAKETRYTIEVAQRCFPGLGYDDELANKLRGLHQVLGKWHDDEIALNHLDHFQNEISVQLNSNEAKGYVTPLSIYEKLTNHLLEEKRTLLKTYEERWDDFMVYLSDKVNI